MVEGAALEMLCTEMYLGFESLTLRQREEQVPTRDLFFFSAEGDRGQFSVSQSV